MGIGAENQACSKFVGEYGFAPDLVGAGFCATRQDARNHLKSSANSYTLARMIVGADAHIGPLGNPEFAEGFRKKTCFLRADRVVRPYRILWIRVSS